MTKAVGLLVALFALWLALSGYFKPFLLSLGVLSCLFTVYLASRMKLLDAAERNHPKAWVAPPVEQVDFSVDLVTENRARLRRIFAAHPPPVVA